MAGEIHLSGKASTFSFKANGEQVYPCRCGQVHQGDFALYDYAHHNCFHDSPLWDTGVDGLLLCPDCGKAFCVAEAGNQ